MSHNTHNHNSESRATDKPKQDNATSLNPKNSNAGSAKQGGHEKGHMTDASESDDVNSTKSHGDRTETEHMKTGNLSSEKSIPIPKWNDQDGASDSHGSNRGTDSEGTASGKESMQKDAQHKGSQSKQDSMRSST